MIMQRHLGRAGAVSYKPALFGLVLVALGASWARPGPAQAQAVRGGRVVGTWYSTSPVTSVVLSFRADGTYDCTYQDAYGRRYRDGGRYVYYDYGAAGTVLTRSNTGISETVYVFWAGAHRADFKVVRGRAWVESSFVRRR
jgi:hypothetical protein